MTTTRTKLAFAAVATLALVGMALTMTVSADVHDRFGEQVVFGDADYIPTITDHDDVDVCIVTFGETNPNNWAAYLKAPHNENDSVQRDDVRLIAYEGHEPGSHVRDAHTVEMGQACGSDVQTANVLFGDVNNNGRYDAGDFVWLSSDTTMQSTSGTTSWTIRLTETSGGDAGTFVFSGNEDHQDYSGAATELDGAQAAFHNVDSAQTPGGEERLTQGDHFYVAIPYQDDGTAATVIAEGHLIPLNSIRIHGPAGDFGSQVGFGDGDYIPLLNEIGDLDTATNDVVCAADLEGDGNVGDFAIYLRLNGDDGGAVPDVGNVEVNMLRLTDTPDGDAGSLVRTGHFAEVGINCEEHAVEVVYADRNNNGRYDGGDWVFLTSDDTNSDIVGTSSTTTWTLRLTDTDTGDAGTFVFTGDTDLTTWRGDVSNIEDDVGFGILDRDRSGSVDDERILTRGDSVYLLRDNTGDENSLVPVYSIRLKGDDGPFGSQVQFGDADFRPTLIEFATPHVCVLELGDDIQSFGFYLTDGDIVERHSVRLVEVNGNPPGSTVRTGDTTEVNQGCDVDVPIDTLADGTASAVGATLNFIDRNNNGRYDEGDDLLLVYQDRTGMADVNIEDRDDLVSSSDSDQWTIRLTGDNAGTLVFSGDSELITYRNDAAQTEDVEVHFFDHDLRGSFSRGDTMYISAAGLDDVHDLVNIHSVRITGELPVTSPPPTTTPTPTPTPTPTDDDDDVTPPPTDDDDVTPPPTDDDDVTPPPTDDDDDEAEEEPTPAPAVFVVLAAIGAALVALRRRK